MWFVVDLMKIKYLANKTSSYLKTTLKSDLCKNSGLKHILIQNYDFKSIPWNTLGLLKIQDMILISSSTRNLSQRSGLSPFPFQDNYEGLYMGLEKASPSGINRFKSVWEILNMVFRKKKLL